MRQYWTRTKGWFIALSSFKKDLVVFNVTIFVCWLHLMIMSNIRGTFRQNVGDGYLTFSKDLIFHAYWLGIVPFAITFLLRNHRSLLALKTRLAAGGICVRPISGLKIFIRVLVITAIGTAVFAPGVATMAHEYWWEAQFSGSYVFLYFLSCCAVAAAACLTCICYAERLAKEIRRKLASSEELEVEVYHPDGCGGLYWISRPFLNLGVVCVPMFLIGLATVVNYCWGRGYTWRHPLVLWNLLWPMVFGPFATFAIVQATGIRKYLIKNKSSRLSRLSQAISDELAKVLTNGEEPRMSDGGGDENRPCARAITLMELYANLEKAFPVWPVPRRILAFATLSGPAISVLGSLVVIVSTLFRLAGK